LKQELKDSQWYTKEHFALYKEAKLKMDEEFHGDYIDWLEVELAFAQILEKNHDGTIDKEYERIVKILTKRIERLRRF